MTTIPLLFVDLPRKMTTSAVAHTAADFAYE